MSVHTILARNVNHGFLDALWLLRLSGEEQPSRNGPVLALPGPLVTTISCPTERVIFWDSRDANPFLHLFESLWMLAGREDVAWPAMFAKQFRQYSDDGETLQGAYGHRWRTRFGVDQLPALIELLRGDPTSRRAVLQMWAADPDLTSAGRDVCCNLSVVFDLRRGELNAFINNRSNDVVWGLFGANIVHFSFLQEYLAAWIGVPVGTMTTFSVNAHAYTSLPRLKDWMALPVVDDRYVSAADAAPYPLLHGFHGSREEWDEGLNEFLDDPEGLEHRHVIPFFSRVAVPMFRAWKSHRDGESENALLDIESVAASDWRVAGREWIQRRIDRKALV